MRVILLGAPGSGKGTQAVLIESRYGFPKISTGDILRSAVQDGTPVGLKVRDLMNRGELVGDDIVAALVEEQIRRPESRNGYVLDGYPRNLAQAREIERMDGSRPEAALEIGLSEEILLERLSRRWVCPRCKTITTQAKPGEVPGNRCPKCREPLVQRDDDKPEVIRERLRVYQEQTRPLREYYANKNAFSLIDGSGTVEGVFLLLSIVLDARLASRTSGH
ncbi:MAG: adenylate kinase [Candidatus Aminicenantes bacterium]|jgi:adenylate kinase|nr:adenylate kinase [Candidatus Aminicenantes bacterium]